MALTVNGVPALRSSPRQSYTSFLTVSAAVLLSCQTMEMHFLLLTFFRSMIVTSRLTRMAMTLSIHEMSRVSLHS